MHHFHVTKQHLTDRKSVEAFFRKVHKLMHYSRLAQEIRSSPVCMCRACSLAHRYAGGEQLRLI